MEAWRQARAWPGRSMGQESDTAMTADMMINVIVMITLIVGLNVTFVELAGV